MINRMNGKMMKSIMELQFIKNLLVGLALFCATASTWAGNPIPAEVVAKLNSSFKQDNIALLSQTLAEADLPLNGRDGVVPLVLAAQNNAPKSLLWLVQQGASVGQADAAGVSALYACALAEYKDGQLTRLLLRHQADIGQTGSDNYNTLDAAMENRNRLFMQIALRHLLEQSVSKGSRLALARLLDGGSTALPRLSKEAGGLLLNLAIVNGDAKLVARLLRQPEHHSLRQKIDPNQSNRSGHYPLNLAASWSEVAMVAQLLKAKARVDQQSQNRYHTSALMESTRDGKVEIAQMLLAHGANVNLPDVHQDHALNWAVFFGRAPMVQLLLAHQADFRQVGQQSNDNAMDIAIRQKVPEVIELLQKAGAQASKGGQKP